MPPPPAVAASCSAVRAVAYASSAAPVARRPAIRRVVAGLRPRLSMPPSADATATAASNTPSSEGANVRAITIRAMREPRSAATLPATTARVVPVRSRGPGPPKESDIVILGIGYMNLPAFVSPAEAAQSSRRSQIKGCLAQDTHATYSQLLRDNPPTPGHAAVGVPCFFTGRHSDFLFLIRGILHCRGPIRSR